MGRGHILASLAIAGVVVAVSQGACSSDDSADGGTDAAASETSSSICDHYTGAGTPCAPISDQRCFPLCTVGGSYCRAGANGMGVWVAVDDESCYPETGAPSDDAGPIDTDSGEGTDTGTAGDASDASDATDASELDAAADAADGAG